LAFGRGTATPLAALRLAARPLHFSPPATIKANAREIVMDRFNRADLKSLVESRPEPCVTIFTNCHPGGAPEDMTRLKEQLHEAERQLLAGKISSEDAVSLLAAARQDAQTPEFWKHASDGLALFIARGFRRTYRLPQQFPNRVAVGSRFLVRPLLPWINDDGRFFLLALSQNKARLFEATAHSVRAINVPDMPASLAEALRFHDRDDVLNVHTHAAPGGRGREVMYHGQGVGIDDHKDEVLTYCQRIDNALRPVLGTGQTPLVLATVEYEAAIYRKANHYPHLHDEVIKGNPDHLGDTQLRDRAWTLMAPKFRARVQQAVARYRQLAGTGRTTNRLEELLPAVQRGEIETLLVIDDRSVWGRFDPNAQRIEQTRADLPDTEDLVNVAVVYAEQHERQIHVVEPDPIFGDSAVAGIYFTPMNNHGKRG
jgi:hypothetical protein